MCVHAGHARASTATFAAVLAGCLLMPTQASAGDRVLRDDLKSQQPTAVLSADGADEDTASFAASTGLSTSPSGCKGFTDYPHKSGSEASVHGRTNCTVAVAYVWVSTDLARDRWYGLEFLENDKSSRNTSKTSYDATPHWNCSGVGTYTYGGYSSHLSIENGKNYSAQTANWEVPGRSRFAC